MRKSPVERKAAQRARQSESGEPKFELVLDSQDMEMLTRNCASRKLGRNPHDMADYFALLIRLGCAAALRQLVNAAAVSAATSYWFNRAPFSRKVSVGFGLVDLIVKGTSGAINAKTVTYDFERLMDGAKLLKYSEFGDAIIENM